jgi:oxaloacetate decarboxylase alpha subunit
MDVVHFVDTTIRDGHQSLWASNMSTGMVLPIVGNLDAAGFQAVELVATAQFKKAVCELREDPWDLIRRVAAGMPRTPLRLNAGQLNTFGFDPPEIYQLRLDLMAANGMKQARISAPWNDLPCWSRRIKCARNAGMTAILNLIYSISPRHTDEYYAERTRQAVSLAPDRLCLKDPSGLLTPDRVRILVPVILANSGGIEVEFHSHCCTGLGPLCALEAVRQGIRVINTGIPPLANGAALPSIFNVAHNLRAMGYATDIDEALLRPVEKHFSIIAKREGLPVGVTAAYDVAQYQHQVPGGMISNLLHQLRQVGQGDRLEQALEEAIRVRAELGYPIMVTPLSQFVGSQAAINVILGERYKEVTDQVIRYALGQHGEEAVELMDRDIRAKILDRPRTREILATDRPPPTLAEVRREHGGPGVSDEELLLRWALPRRDIEAMRAAPQPVPYVTERHPIVSLLGSLSERTQLGAIDISRPGFSLSLRRS